jgi:hypothetical protein
LYFEPVKDRKISNIEPQETGDLANFEVHLLAQLPRLFERSLEIAPGYDLPVTDKKVRDYEPALF